MKEDIETSHDFRQVVIEEYYSRKDGEIFYHWRLNGGEWRVDKTALPDIPWLEFPTKP